MAYGQIGGALPFSGGAKDYASAYQQALSFNSANYNQILQGYNATSNAQQQGQNQIMQGYNTLTGQVLGGIQGIDAGQRQAIKDQYVSGRGQAQQTLINRGLGNSTIQSGVDRGFLYDKAKADINLTNSTQGINAQYQSQLGLAGLNYQNQALQQNTGLAQDQLHWLNSINAAYPDAASYAKMAMMKGQTGGGGFQGQSAAPASSGSSLGKAPAIPGYSSMSAGSSGYGGRPWTPGSTGGYGASQTLSPEDASMWSSGAAGDFGENTNMYNWEKDSAGNFSTTPMGDGSPGYQDYYNTYGAWGDEY